MNKAPPPQEPLPSFVSALSLKELESFEEKLVGIHSKIMSIAKMLTNDNEIKTLKKDTTTFLILTRTIVSCNRIEVLVKEQQDQIKFEDYLEAIDNMLGVVETACFVNKVGFWNKKFLLHYKDVFNTILSKTRAKDVVNYCVEKLQKTSES